MFKILANQKQELTMATMFLFNQDESGNLIENLPLKIPVKFSFIWPNGFRGEEFYKLTNQKLELPMAAMFVNGLGRNEKS